MILSLSALLCSLKRNRRYIESSPKKQKRTVAAEVNVNNESYTKRTSFAKESECNDEEDSLDVVLMNYTHGRLALEERTNISADNSIFSRKTADKLFNILVTLFSKCPSEGERKIILEFQMAC